MAELTSKPSPGIFGTKVGSKSCKLESAQGSTGTSSQIPNCPKCSSRKVWRNGYYTPMFGERVQRWFCRDCDFKFSDPKDLAMAREALQQIQTIESKGLKTNSDLSSFCQICVSETKNLTTELQSKTVPEGCELSIEQRQILQGKIVEFQWHLKKHNYSEDTYMPYGENLKFLVKNDADLLNVDSVKTVVTKLQKTDIRKYNLIKAYKAFMGYIGLKAELPTYTYIRTLPFIPRETEIDQLIAGCCSYSKQMSIFLQLLKETGARMGEAWRLTFGDIDDLAKTVSIKAEKGSNSRLNKISDKLIMLMFSLNKNAIPDLKQRVFSWKQKCYIGRSFRKMRARIVANTGNQRLLKIHFHTMRYWKGTQTYIKTKSLAHVMVQLGHKSWSSAELYVSLAEATAQTDFRWVSAVARTLDEALKLTNDGFQYDTDWEPGVKIYKKMVE